jgi:hypothetical protein
MGILCYKAIHWTLPKIKNQQLQKGHKVEPCFFKLSLKSEHTAQLQQLWSM